MVIKMRSLGISAISVALTAAVVGNAYYQKKQFYPSVVYITKSNPSMTVSSWSQTSPVRYLQLYCLHQDKWTDNIFTLSFAQVIYVQSLVFVLMLGKLMRKVCEMKSFECRQFIDWHNFLLNLNRFSWELYAPPNSSIWWNDSGMHWPKRVWRSQFSAMISTQSLWHYSRCCCFWNHSIGWPKKELIMWANVSRHRTGNLTDSHFFFLHRSSI